MKQKTKHFRHTKQSKVIFVLSVLVAAYWYFGKTLNDVYDSKLKGAIFEILWLPMIILLFVLPIVSIGFFVKDKFNPRSFYLYSLLVGVGAILITILM